jgi:hypothetical protein
MKKSIILFLFVVLIISLFFSCDNDNNDIEKYWEFYNSKLESFKQENLEYKNKSVDVVFLGDSLTEGYDIEEFYPEYVVLNRGISGDTTVGLEQRLDVSLFAISNNSFAYSEMIDMGQYRNKVYFVDTKEMKSLCSVYIDEKILKLGVCDDYMYILTETGIFKVDRMGKIKKETLSSPVSIVVSPEGNVFVCGESRADLIKFDN